MGRKEENIRRAIEHLKGNPLISVAGVAPLYRTDPVGYTDQDWFLNTVADLVTELTPHELLAFLLDTENKMGRERTIHWGPRLIDLDMLLYGDLTIDTPELQVPHPRMGERAFVAVPLADLCPDLLLPGGGRAADLAAGLSRTQRIERWEGIFRG